MSLSLQKIRSSKFLRALAIAVAAAIAVLLFTLGRSYAEDIVIGVVLILFVLGFIGGVLDWSQESRNRSHLGTPERIAIVNKARRLQLTIIHLAIAALLFAAVGKQGHNYYVLLRFLVTGSSIFISHYWWDKTRIVSILFIAAGILFNPLLPFTFSKGTWGLIDLVAALIFGLSALSYLPFTRFFLLGALLFLAAGYASITIVRDVLLAIRLSDGTKTTGEIIDVDEQIEDCEACSGGVRRTYDTTYQFRTNSGQLIESRVSLGYDPLENANDRRVEVVYNPSNPQESRLAHARQTTIRGAVGLGVLKGAFAVLLCIFGIEAIRSGIKKFQVCS